MLASHIQQTRGIFAKKDLKLTWRNPKTTVSKRVMPLSITTACASIILASSDYPENMATNPKSPPSQRVPLIMPQTPEIIRLMSLDIHLEIQQSLP